MAPGAVGVTPNVGSGSLVDKDSNVVLGTAAHHFSKVYANWPAVFQWDDDIRVDQERSTFSHYAMSAQYSVVA